MIYLDTAAVVKLVRREPESGALVDWLDARPDSPRVSSVLAEVELPRAVRRSEPALLARIPAVLERLGRYEIDDLVRRTTASYPQSDLRSLDAIHLATAYAVFGPELEYFVSYDARLLLAAESISLPTARPVP